MSGKHVQDLFKDNRISVITFSTTDASFAIPLEQVRYIEKDVKRNLQLSELDQFNHEVITYQNKTVQLFDFNKLIGAENHGKIIDNLVSALEVGEKESQKWLTSVKEAIKAESTIDSSTHAKMREFITWLGEYESSVDELDEVLKKLINSGETLTKKAENLISAGLPLEDKISKLASIETTELKEFVHLCQLAKERAITSVRPIIVFVEHKDGDTAAIRLDNINDIATYSQKDFCRDNSTEGIMKKNDDEFVVEGFLRDGDNPPCMLINCQPQMA